MTNQGGGPYGGHPPSQIYSMSPTYSNTQTDGMIPKNPAHSFDSRKENTHPNIGYVDPRYINTNGRFHYQQQPAPVPSFHHQPGPSYVAQQLFVQPSQRAIAVAVPPLSPAANVKIPSASKPNPPQSVLQAPSMDHCLLLLLLAEEYLTAAYNQGSRSDILWWETEMQEYYDLIATGLGCLEAVLSKHKLQPEIEARVRLRYATILFEETENVMEAEEALSKGIAIADRHKLFDLKYNMQHLLARIFFQSRANAAFKFIDGIIKDAEAYQHVAWVYAFRFLKVSLHLELSFHQDITSALTTLKVISSTATKLGDRAILAIATTMEALTYLKEANTAESFEQAQRALASVRSLQLNPLIGSLPQLSLLTAYTDLCCYLQQFDPSQAMQKMQIMQSALATVAEGQGWLEDGTFAIAIPISRMPLCKTENGIVRKQDDDSLALIFNWLPKDDVYNVGYFLSGVAMAQRNTSDGHKSEQMLQEGIRRQTHAQKEASKLSKSISSKVTQHFWRQQMSFFMHLHLAFILCARSSWTAAQQHLTNIREMKTSWSSCPRSLDLLFSYLSATIAQGTGDLSTSFEIYRRHTVTSSTTTTKSAYLSQDVALLCTLNAILIIRTPSHPSHHILSSLLGSISQICPHHTNRQIQSAYHLLLSTLPSSTTIIAVKQSLHSALRTAKATSNNQLMCVVLNIMSWKFFRGVVGEQAEKSARASQSLARKVGDGLWMCVSAGVVGETLESAGREAEAEKARKEGWQKADELPSSIRQALGYVEDNVQFNDAEMKDD